MKWRSLEESASSSDIRPLRDILAGRKELIAKYVPAETQAIHAQAIVELKARNLAANILPVGAKAPQFELPDHDGRVVRSSDVLSKGRLVLSFVRGRWCPFCVSQMEAMNLMVPQIEQEGATLAAVSPQTVKQSYFMHDQHKLRFALLSDGENKVARQFGLTYRVPAMQEAVYRRAFVNLPFTNGDDSWELPIPATYIIDRDGLFGPARMKITPNGPNRWRLSQSSPACHPEPQRMPVRGTVHQPKSDAVDKTISGAGGIDDPVRCVAQSLAWYGP